MEKFIEFVEQFKAAAIIAVLVGLVFKFGYLFLIKRGILVTHPQTDALTSDKFFFWTTGLLFLLIFFITYTREK